MVASLLETVFITNIQYSSSETRDVPHWLSVLVLRYLAVVVGLRQKENSRTTIFLNPSATTGMSILFTDIKYEGREKMNAVTGYVEHRLEGVGAEIV